MQKKKNKNINTLNNINKNDKKDVALKENKYF
jgi:hypothetical protein